MAVLKLILLSVFTFNLVAFAQEYQLLVNVKDDKDNQRLIQLGFRNCQKISQSTLVCVKSKDLNYLMQLRDFLEKNGFKASIGNVNQTKTNIEQKPDESTKVEKTEKPKNKSVSNTQKTEKMEVEEIKEKPNNIIVEKSDEKLKLLYKEFNNGNYTKALEIAESLKKTKYRNDANFVIGLIYLKSEKFGESCNIFKEVQSFKPEAKELVKDACYVHHMKLGYEYLEKGNLEKAYENFKSSLSYKYNIESKIGLFYTYLEQKEYKKAEEEIKTLYNQHPNNKKVIQAYIDYLIETDKLDEIEKFKDYLSEEQKNTLKSKLAYKDLNSIKNYIESKEFEVAESKLKELYLQNPNNIYVLLNFGYLYLEKGEVEKAENYYRNVILLDNNNIEALKGLKAFYIKTRRYEEALEIIEKLKALGIYDKDEKKVKELLFLSKAQEEYKKKNLDLAEKFALEVLDLNKNNPIANLILSNVYKDKNDIKKSFQYISKAYELDPKNTGIKIAYMYGLVNLGLFDQAKTLLSTINPKNLSQEEKDSLREFYKLFYEKVASYYLNVKNYNIAKKVALEGLEIFPNNKALMEALGWSCYNLKDYGCSEKIFSQILLVNPNDENAKVGLAYTYLNLKKVKELEKLLKDLESSTDPNVLKELATIYYSMERYKDAEKVIKKYENLSVKTEKSITNTEKTLIKQENTPTKIRTEREIPFILDYNLEIPSESINPQSQIKLQQNEIAIENQNSLESQRLNEKEISDLDKKKDDTDISKIKEKIKIKKQEYEENIVLGFKVRDKTGESGKSKLTDLSPFIKFSYYFNENFMVYLGTYFTNLNSGTLKDYANFGTPQNITILRNVPSSYSGFEPFGGFSLNTTSFDLLGKFGLTPMVNNGISSKFVYEFEGKLKNDNNKISVGLYQKPVRDSILSYVGTVDPYSYKNWGRVVTTGVKVSYEQSLGSSESFVYSQLSLEKLKGENVEENTNINLIVLPKIFYGKLIGDKDYLGLFLLYNRYSKDQDCYYYGCGGYFSPESMFIVAPMIEGFYFMNERFGLHYKFFLGSLILKNKGKTSTDLAFDGYLGGVYMLRDNIFLNLAGEYRKTSKYSEIFSSVFLQYFFGKRFNVNENDLIKLEKEIYK